MKLQKVRKTAHCNIGTQCPPNKWLNTDNKNYELLNDTLEDAHNTMRGCMHCNILCDPNNDNDKPMALCDSRFWLFFEADGSSFDSLMNGLNTHCNF